MEFQAMQLWGTPIIAVKNPQHAQIKDAIVRNAYEREKQAAQAIESGVTTIKKHNLYESKFDFLKSDLPEIVSLRQFCGQAVSQSVYNLMKQAGNRPPERIFVDFIEAWVHITRDGGYHDMHYHPNCSWCGIYYIDIGNCTLTPPNGINRFYPPVDLGYEDLGSMAFPQLPVSMPPEDGKLVLFPSYVRHSAVPYRGQRDRILMAFNSRVMATPA